MLVGAHLNIDNDDDDTRYRRPSIYLVPRSMYILRSLFFHCYLSMCLMCCYSCCLCCIIRAFLFERTLFTVQPINRSFVRPFNRSLAYGKFVHFSQVVCFAVVPAVHCGHTLYSFYYYSLGNL